MKAAQEYAAHGMALVPLPRGQKGPVAIGWNEPGGVITDATAAAAMTGNIGLAHAYSTPRTATIDIDDLKKAVPLLATHGIDLPALINAPDSVLILSGRENRTKLLFRLQDDIPALASKVLKVDGKAVFEFRCATADGKTVQDVLPPSIHPDTHEPYRWGGSGSWTALPPLPMPVSALWESLIHHPPKPSSEPCLLGPRPHYLGNKSSAITAMLAGGSLPATPENVSQVKAWLSAIPADCARDLWLKILFAVHDLQWDSGEDLARQWSRSAPHKFGERDFLLAWNSFKPDGGITWRSLPFYAEQHKDTGQSPPRDTNASSIAPPAPTWVAGLNERFAEVRVGSNVLILDQCTPIEAPTGLRYTASYLELAAFRQMHNGRFAEAAAGVTRAQPLAAAWLAHPQRRQYQGAVFSPDSTVPRDILNLWTGFAVESVAGDITLWLTVLEAVVPDSATRRYVLNWLALKIKAPGSVPGTILLVKGGKGTGKNSLFEPVVRIFGSHGRVFDDAEQIAGRFTGHLQTVAFAVLDEALFTGNSQQADRIKSRVTATSTTFESKGRDPIAGVNRCAFVSLSNHDHIWQASVDERRAVIVEASNTLVNDRAFWKTYYAWLDGPGPGALLHHFQCLDLQGFDPRLIPKGEALRRQIEQTALRDPVTAWWFGILSEGGFNLRERIRITLSDNDPTEISKADLHQSFQDATVRTRGTIWPHAMRKVKVWAGPDGLVERRPRSENIGRGRSVILACLPQLQKAFELATGIRVEREPDP